jgi:hypothetical protein
MISGYLLYVFLNWSTAVVHTEWYATREACHRAELIVQRNVPDVREAFCVKNH